MENEADEPTQSAPAPKPTPKSSDVSDEEDDALAAMMAFQEEQEPEESKDLVEDDPNIVFLQDGEDDNEEADQHPNHNNPAAVALRARLEQNRQRAQHAQLQGANQSLLRRVISGILYMRYAPLSFLAAFLLIFHTLRTRQQFYLTVIYLQSSKLSYIVLGNAIVALGVSTFSFVTRLFLDGGLRVNERDAIGEHIRWDVTETCLALTIFRSEMDVRTAIMFLGLVIMKCVHWSVELRGGHLRMTEEVFTYPEDRTNDDENQRNNLSWYRRLPRFRMSHIRFYSLLEILILLDIVAVAHCALSVATDGPSVSILFGFEFAILLVSALKDMGMYHLHVVDGVMGFLHHCAEGEHHYNPVGGLAEPHEHERGEESLQVNTAPEANEENPATGTSTSEAAPARPKTLSKTLVERIANPWKNRRATLSFAIELLAQAAKFIFYVVFFAIVFTYYGMPINIFREVYVAFQQLRRRLIAFNNYRRLTHNMEKRFESIKDDEELDRLGHTCIICRDQMDLSGGCKKLPICGHAFHTHCLREWLVQQQSCPTCRADIAANEARRKKQLEREATADAAEAVGATVQTTTATNVANAEVVAEAEHLTESAPAAGSPHAPAQEGKKFAKPLDPVQQRQASFQEAKENTEQLDQDSSLSAQGGTDLLMPGWVEEWDPVSNKIYYWNKETSDTSWTKPIMPGRTEEWDPVRNGTYNRNKETSESSSKKPICKSPDALLRDFNGLLQRRAQKGESPLRYLEPELRRSFPCLYRVVNPIGAVVLAKDSTAVVRHIVHGKIIVCTTMEYWTEIGPVLAMPDGYVKMEDVARFLALDKPDNDLKPAAVRVAS